MDLFTNSILEKCRDIFKELASFDDATKIEVGNSIKSELHKYSPMKNEPVDCVLWVKAEDVIANDYNPNAVAPPEMKLLALSVSEDGYTQPIVTWRDGQTYEIVDGWHRNRVGREIKEIAERIQGYLPVTVINDSRSDKSDRIASTIRHNRARGKHRVDAMSDIVIELKRRNWSDSRIGKELGMDDDEVLRLCQITGLTEVFSNQQFSEAWEARIFSDDDSVEIDFEGGEIGEAKDETEE